MPILAKGKTVTGHIWTYVRNDCLFGGTAPPADQPAILIERGNADGDRLLSMQAIDASAPQLARSASEFLSETVDRLLRIAAAVL